MSEALDEAIRSYYERRPEEDRLSTGPSRLEAQRTRDLVLRFAPDPPAVVVDVGGAAGAHALWLAERGYEVHLAEPVERLLRLASEASASAERPLASLELADARALPLADASADAVLLLGPLYHLTAARERARAVAEARRVLRPGGLLFAACITRWASLLDGLARDLLADPHFVGIVEEDLRTGQHRNPEERPRYFTTAYFHDPEELAAEVRGGGFALEGLFGLEGPGWLLPDFDARWADPRRRADLLRAAEAVEEEPSLLGVSAHLLAVGRAP